MAKQANVHKINPLNVFYFTKYISDNFGLKLTLILSSVYYGLKGIINFGVNAALLPYARRVPLSPQMLLTTTGLLMIPWAIKGFFGVCSDVFPIGGYRKRYYMIFFCFVAFLTLILIVVIPYSVVESFQLLPAILLFFPHSAASICDLLCEGKYVEQMKKKPETKHAIVMYIWWCQLFGGFLAFLIVGPMADAFDPRYIYIIFLPFALQPCIFLWSGCMIDDAVEPYQSNRIDMQIVSKKWKLIIMAMLTAIGALGSYFTALTGNSTVQAIYALTTVFIMGLVSLYFLRRIIAFANIYLCLAYMFYINITGPLEYYYTSGEDCVPDGTAFSITFFKTYTGIVGQLFSLVGLFIFNRYIAKFKFRVAFWCTTCLRVIVSIFDIILIQRWNRAIGISDKVVYILGNGAIHQTTYMMDFLPATLMMAKLCPKEVESTVYSILAGFANFGTSASAFVGVFLSDLLKIDGLAESEDGTPCNFENLTWLVVICHAILPMCIVPLTFVLIPDAYPYEDILGEQFIQDKNAIKNGNEVEIFQN